MESQDMDTKKDAETKEAPKNKKDKKEKSPKQPLIDEILDYMKAICCAILVILLIFTFVGRDAWVNGPSMEETLHDGDLMILRSCFYKPKQGDIIACNCEGLNKVIVKRIAAVGGQTVTVDFSAGKVYVDGEEFLVEGIPNITTLYEGQFIENVTVPDGKYFVLGDNRQNSTDSRDARVGFVDREDILGKVTFRIYPFDKIKYFK